MQSRLVRLGHKSCMLGNKDEVTNRKAQIPSQYAES